MGKVNNDNRAGDCLPAAYRLRRLVEAGTVRTFMAGVCHFMSQRASARGEVTCKPLISYLWVSPRGSGRERIGCLKSAKWLQAKCR